MSGDAPLVQRCELRAATDVCAALAALQLDHLAVDDAWVVVSLLGGSTQLSRGDGNAHGGLGGHGRLTRCCLVGKRPPKKNVAHTPILSFVTTDRKESSKQDVTGVGAN